MIFSFFFRFIYLTSLKISVPGNQSGEKVFFSHCPFWKDVLYLFSCFLFVDNIDKCSDLMRMSCPRNVDAKIFNRYAKVDDNAILQICKWKISMMQMPPTEMQALISMIHDANASIEMQMCIFMQMLSIKTQIRIFRCMMQMLYSNLQNVNSRFLMQMFFFKDTNVNFYFMVQMLSSRCKCEFP